MGIVVLAESYGSGNGPRRQHRFAKSGLPWLRGWVRGWVRCNGTCTTVVYSTAQHSTVRCRPSRPMGGNQRTKAGRRCSDTVGEQAGPGRNGKSRVCRTSAFAPSHRIIAQSRLACWGPAWRPRRFVLVAEWPEAGRALLRGSYSLDGGGEPCLPPALSVSHPFLPHDHAHAHAHDAARTRPEQVSAVRITVPCASPCRALASRRLCETLPQCQGQQP